MQYVWQSGEEQVKSSGANENSTKYDMLKMILEANLKLINIYETKSEQEKELITYSTVKDLMEFGKMLESSFNFAKS